MDACLALGEVICAILVAILIPLWIASGILWLLGF